MFHYLEKSLSKQTFHFQIQQHGRLLSFRTVLQLWQQSEDFRLFYNNILEEVPFLGFFWEHKAVTLDTLDQVYEFVIVKTKLFDGKMPQRQAFKEHFTADLVVSFPNLGHTANLVIPCPTTAQEEEETYGHIAAFIRNAPTQQISEFWKQIGVEVEKSLNEKPVWLSTSGLGVYWLHARLDQVPKYYSHAPYRLFSTNNTTS